jgi:hypothetical protein
MLILGMRMPLKATANTCAALLISPSNADSLQQQPSFPVI